jgi:hypothetical protein
MRGDRRIQEAIEAGEKNKRTWELVRNWCANVRMRKFGGTGMVEQMTGCRSAIIFSNARMLQRVAWPRST